MKAAVQATAPQPWQLADGATAALLPNGALHLDHGPIHLVISADGSRAAVEAAYGKACRAFEGLLGALAQDLPRLRKPLNASDQSAWSSRTAERMVGAVAPFNEFFVTPMAAVAGSVADEIVDAIWPTPGLTRAYVNNGGDIALRLAEGQSFTLGVVESLSHGQPTSKLTVSRQDGIRGIATSGWSGHSFSLGIADAVTVVAASAAAADAAATLIANSVDSDHAAIRRRPAQDMDPDNDLGLRLVTVEVPPLPRAAVEEALDRGAHCAVEMLAQGLIAGALLCLQGKTRTVGTIAIMNMSAP